YPIRYGFDLLVFDPVTGDIRRYPENTPAARVGSGAAAYPRIVPVGHKQRTIRGNTHVDRPEPLIVHTLEKLHDLPCVPGSVLFYRITSNHIRCRVGVDHLSPENIRQQIAFIHGKARRRTRTGNKKIGNNTGVVLVPMPLRDFRLHVSAVGRPMSAVHFVEVAVVAVLYNKVDATARVAVVVVVGLPDVSIGVYRNLVVVSEVVAKHFEVASVGITPKDYAADVVAAIRTHFVANLVDDNVAEAVHDRPSPVAHIEVELAIRTKHHRVRGMIAGIAHTGEELFFLVGL